MLLGDLSPDERVALGGLLRLMLRSDGQFSEAEEATLERIGTRLGGDAGSLWKVISQSAQQCPENEQIRSAAKAVQRAEARKLIRSLLEEVAASDAVSAPESELLAWLQSAWA
ncbi:MAG TPA: hypothetical protein VHM19_09665 [Polyangiales bacterium]|nr:hypothetical protein [Polyangiales bacterium]